MLNDVSFKLRRRTIPDVVAEHIRRMIFDGELTAGQRIPREQIAENLGISVTPVREALTMLEHNGLVTIEAHRGAYVRTLEREFVSDHYSVVGLLIGLSAERVALAQQRQTIERLRRLTEECAAEFAGARVAEIAFDYHYTLNHAVPARQLRNMLRTVSPLIPSNFLEFMPGIIGQIKRGLGVLTEAIEAADPDRARLEARRYMQEQGELVIQWIEAHHIAQPTAPPAPVVASTRESVGG